MNRERQNLILWISIIICAILVLLLSYQNIVLKKTVMAQRFGTNEYAKIKAQMFEDRLEANYLFKKLPMTIDHNSLTFPDTSMDRVINGYIFIVFDLTVCGKCLKNEMQALKPFMDELYSKNISVISIVGLADKNEKSSIVSLRQSGYIYFPCRIINAGEIYEKFNLNKNVFLDTPFFIYTNHELVVLDICKPNEENEEELVQWLKIITKQELF